MGEGVEVEGGRGRGGARRGLAASGRSRKCSLEDKRSGECRQVTWEGAWRLAFEAWPEVCVSRRGGRVRFLLTPGEGANPGWRRPHHLPLLVHRLCPCS